MTLIDPEVRTAPRPEYQLTQQERRFIEIFRGNSDLANALMFSSDGVSGGAYRYDLEGALPGIAFRLGSDLRKQADEALLKMRADGDYDLIKQKWFGTGS